MKQHKKDELDKDREEAKALLEKITKEDFLKLFETADAFEFEIVLPSESAND